MSSAPIVIRPERPDHPQVRLLLRELDAYLATLYPPQDNFILGEQALLAPDVSLLVAEAEGRIVGCGAVRRVPGQARGAQHPYGEVKRMMVAPAHRGRRIGAQLLEALESVLRRAAIHWVLLETGDKQADAIALYERCGYRRCAAFGDYPDTGALVFFEKSLAP